METKFTKEDLLMGQNFIFENEDDILELSFSNKIQHHTGHGFCLWFNGSLESFKTFRGFQNRANSIIDKYDLVLTDQVGLNDSKDDEKPMKTEADYEQARPRINISDISNMSHSFWCDN